MIEIEEGAANVYEDLGLPDAAEMQVKASLAAKIGEIIKRRHLTQVQASEVLGMPQPKLSGMLRGQFRGIVIGGQYIYLGRLLADSGRIVARGRRGREDFQLTVSSNRPMNRAPTA